MPQHKKIVWMFSGQGSQYYWMGKELYQHHPIFKKWMHFCNDIVGSHISYDLCGEIYRERINRFEPFERTLHTHPALLMIQYSLAMTLMDEGFKPDILLGYSAGEIVSHVLAGSLSIHDAFSMMIHHARLSEEMLEAGRMLAVMAQHSLFHEPVFANTTLAAVNFEKHFVVSGAQDEIDRLKVALKLRDILFVDLPILQAFHSPIMDVIKSQMNIHLKNIKISHPSIPVMSSALIGYASQPSAEYFWNVTRNPVMFSKTIAELESSGPSVFIDLGPSGTLATFVKYNMNHPSQSVTSSVMTPFGKDLQSLENLKNIVD